MRIKDKQLESFIAQAQEVAREWTIAEVEGKDTHPEFSNKMYLIHTLAKEVINAEDDKAVNED